MTGRIVLILLCISRMLVQLAIGGLVVVLHRSAAIRLSGGGTRKCLTAIVVHGLLSHAAISFAAIRVATREFIALWRRGHTAKVVRDSWAPAKQPHLAL
jgi:hypothetical protein